MLTTHIMRNNTILLQMQAIEITTTEMAKNKTKTDKKLFCSDADYGDYDYPSSTGCDASGCGGGADGQGFGGIQPRKGGRFFSATIMSVMFIFPHF